MKNDKDISNNIVYFLWIVFILVTIVQFFSIYSSISGYSLNQNGQVGIRIVNRTIPYIYPVNIVAHLGDHVQYQVIADDIGGDDVFFYDTCDIFDINHTTGIIDFTPNISMLGITNCTINATDYQFSNSTNATIEIISVCGDGYCSANENYLNCPLDCEAPVQPPSGGGGGGGIIKTDKCTPRYECTEWGACRFDGFAYRSCELVNDCQKEGEKPLLSKQCTYGRTELESRLYTASQLMEDDPIAAVKELDYVLKLKLEDILLLKQLYLENSQEFELTEDIINEVLDYLERTEETIEESQILGAELEYSVIATMNSNLFYAVRTIPEIELDNKNCEHMLDNLTALINITDYQEFYETNENFKLQKCFYNYRISNLETTDYTMNRAKAILDLKARQAKNRVKVFEKISKEYAPNSDYLIFNEGDDIEIIDYDPIFVWSLSDIDTNDEIQLTYVVKDHIYDSETSIAEYSIKEPETAFAKVTTCYNQYLVFKTIIMFVLFVMVFALILTNPFLSSELFDTTDKWDILFYRLNSVCYYSIYILGMLIILIDLICFNSSYIKEIILLVLLMLVTYYFTYRKRQIRY